MGEGSTVMTDSSNMTGIVSLLSNVSHDSVYDWIIDSGISHHIIFCKDVLECLKAIEGQNSYGVETPTRDK